MFAVTERVRSKVRGLALVVTSFAIAMAIVGLCDRADPRSAITAETPTPIVPPGGTFGAKFRLMIERDCAGIIYSTITSDNSDWEWSVDEWTVHANSRTGGVPGIRKTIEIPSITIPPGAPEGPVTLHTEAIFYCNPMHYLWPLRVSYPPVKFKIAPTDGR